MTVLKAPKRPPAGHKGPSVALQCALRGGTSTTDPGYMGTRLIGLLSLLVPSGPVLQATAAGPT